MNERTQMAAVDAGYPNGTPAEVEMRAERYQVELKNAITGEVLGYGGGDTPEEACRMAIEDARVSGELEQPLETNDDGVRD